MLGVILVFESLSLMALMRDIAGSKSDLFVCLLVALAALGLPQGYVVGLLIGTAVWYLIQRGAIMRSL
jgi:hypothetical protein